MMEKKNFEEYVLDYDNLILQELNDFIGDPWVIERGGVGLYHVCRGEGGPKILTGDCLKHDVFVVRAYDMNYIPFGWEDLHLYFRARDDSLKSRQLLSSSVQDFPYQIFENPPKKLKKMALKLCVVSS